MQVDIAEYVANSLNADKRRESRLSRLTVFSTIGAVQPTPIQADSGPFLAVCGRYFITALSAMGHNNISIFAEKYRPCDLTRAVSMLRFILTHFFHTHLQEGPK